MLLTPNYDPTIQMLQQKLRLIRPGNVFPVFYGPVLVNLCELQPQFPVLSCSCCIPCTSRFHVLCIQRCSSACLGCNEWLFELLLPFYQLEPVWPFSSDLWHQQGICAQRTAAHWIVSLFRPFSVNHRDGSA
ncbi:hypothetical protein AMECASPLE_027644 [Ameca splendens]|uniref:Uncharacterized protein n=1 Tax=Ameca splendens TaxID=208324 RepID=A0ABV0Z3J7_9TELE